MSKEIEDILDLTDPVMDMVDAVIDDIEEAEFELESCLNEADMILVETTADEMIGVPGFELGKEDVEDDYDPYKGIELF